MTQAIDTWDNETIKTIDRPTLLDYLAYSASRVRITVIKPDIPIGGTQNFQIISSTIYLLYMLQPSTMYVKSLSGLFLINKEAWNLHWQCDYVK